MIKQYFFSISLSLLFIFSISCKKTETSSYDATKKGTLSVEFDNIVGESNLQLNTGSYTNAAGEPFKVSALKYFVSNFILTKSDGTTYTIPQDSCYFLIDESDAAKHSAQLQIPEGEYKGLSFVLGVDSLRNTLDISKRTGVLDPAVAAAGMYWAWNSGYVFLKLEGTSSASIQANNIFMYHIGLYGGSTTPTFNNIKTISLDLSQRGVAQVQSTKSANVHLTVDILKIFSGTSNVSIAANTVVMASAYSQTIANNYAKMFSHDHTEN